MKVLVTYDGTTPHPDAGRETFAQRTARGVAQATAYRECVATGPITRDSAKSCGLRVAREPAVAARVAAIRDAFIANRSVTDGPLSQADILALLQSVTESYQLAIGTLDMLGVNPSTVASLRAELLLHLGRLNRVAPARPSAPVMRDDSLIADALARMPVCRCDAPHSAKAAHTAP